MEDSPVVIGDYYGHCGEEVADAIRSGESPSQAVAALLMDSYTSVMVVRSLREGTNLSLVEAYEYVLSHLNNGQQEWLRKVWATARSRIGESLDDLLAITLEPGENDFATPFGMDVDDAKVTMAIERVRSAPLEDVLVWLETSLRSRLDPSSDRAPRLLLYMAAEALVSPAELVPALLDAARLEDASFCAWPLNVIRRSSLGASPVLNALEELDRCDDPSGRVKAGQWRYWIRQWPAD